MKKLQKLMIYSTSLAAILLTFIIVTNKTVIGQTNTETKDGSWFTDAKITCDCTVSNPTKDCQCIVKKGGNQDEM